MRRRLLLLPVLALLLAPATLRAQTRIAETRPATAGGAIRIHNLAGSVRVLGWDRDSIAVQGTTAASAQEFTFHVSGGNAKLGVWSGTGEAPETQLVVRVPRRSRVWIKTESAPVEVTDVTGGVDVATVSGRVRVRGTLGELLVESLAGALDLEVEARVLRAHTAGGDIHVSGRIADAQVLSVSGTVSVYNKQVQRGRFESVEGRVQYRGGLTPASVVEFITHSGDIDIRLARDADAQLRVSSFQGRVESELAGKWVSGAGRSEQSVTLGEGSAELTVRTFKGTVRLGYL